MKKVGDLFEELGFRKEGSDSVKRAFIENLVKAAGQTPAAAAAAPTPKVRAKTPAKEQQLSFNFDALESDGPETPFPKTKRSAG